MKHEIIFLSRGFVVPSISRATDNNLSKLEESLSDQLKIPVGWANTDDLGYLSVSFQGNYKILLDETQKQIIHSIINKTFK